MKPTVYPTEFGVDGVSADEILSGVTDAYFELFRPFEPVTASGTTPEQIPVPEEAWAGVVEIDFEGEGRIAVCTVAADGTVIDTQVDTTGPYTGAVAYGADDEDRFSEEGPDPSTTATSLVVDADEPWTLTVSSVADAGVLPVPHSDTGDAVFWYVEGEGDRDVTVTHEGPGDFTFVQYYYWAVPKVLVTTTGSGSESIMLRPGSMLVTVRADGPWTIE